MSFSPSSCPCLSAPPSPPKKPWWERDRGMSARRKLYSFWLGSTTQSGYGKVLYMSRGDGSSDPPSCKTRVTHLDSKDLNFRTLLLSLSSSVSLLASHSMGCQLSSCQQLLSWQSKHHFATNGNKTRKFWLCPIWCSLSAPMMSFST